MQNQYAAGWEKVILPGQMNIRMPWEKFTRIYEKGPQKSYTMIFAGYESISEICADAVKQIYQDGLPPKSTLPTVFCLPEIILQTDLDFLY